MMKRKILVAVVVILAIVFTALALETIRDTEHRLQLKEVQLQERGAELKKLELKYRNLNVELDKIDKNNKKKIEQLEREKRELDEDRKRLERELQAKLQRKEQERLAKLETQKNLINTVTATQTASAYSGSINCSNPSSAKAFIYCKESGNDPNAVNSTGCRGIGQACPGSKLPCSGSDYACQDTWFTNYMQQRYGSWENAKAHWLARVPINGVDVGHWW